MFHSTHKSDVLALTRTMVRSSSQSWVLATRGAVEKGITKRDRLIYRTAAATRFRRKIPFPKRFCHLSSTWVMRSLQRQLCMPHR